MPTDFPLVQTFLLAMADDELILGHRDAEWTGYAPILEEDIAFSNIAQDEIGHALVWYSLLERLTGRTPDQMAFERIWSNFTCCRFVSYPKGDFAYTVVRQYLFDTAEDVRLTALTESSDAATKEAAGKLLKEEAYHLMHSRALVERLGDATDESHSRMQTAVDAAFPQALGMFEELEGEDELVRIGVFPGNKTLQERWISQVVPVLTGVSLAVAVQASNGALTITCAPDTGGRRKSHASHLKQLVDDMQFVYRLVPGGTW